MEYQRLDFFHHSIRSLKSPFLASLASNLSIKASFLLNKFAILLILIVQSFFTSPLIGNVNLEEKVQDFVLETKKISIPGYPHAFNPSIIRWKDQLLLCFRDIPDIRHSFNSEIGLVWLDDQFNPSHSPQLLDIKGPYSIIPSRAEDARLICIQNKLYMVYSDNRDAKITRGGFRVYVAEIRYDGKEFSLHDLECLSQFENASTLKREKNWVPFVYNHNLLLSYSLSPHLVFRPLLNGDGKCETFSRSNQSLQWNWGELRGGSPGLQINKNQYLSFFHSSIDMQSQQSNMETMAHYFMGAYLYSNEPPFEITHISPEPIVGKNFYNGKAYKPFWKPVRVIFPGGFVYDENNIWVVYGRQDHEVWVVKLNKNGLLNSLVPISSK